MDAPTPTAPPHRWIQAKQMADWAIPAEILTAAPRRPFVFNPETSAAPESGEFELSQSNQEAAGALGRSGTVLDVGCGGGSAAFAVAAHAHAQRRVVVEITPEHPQRRRNKLWKHFRNLDRPSGWSLAGVLRFGSSGGVRRWGVCTTSVVWGRGRSGQVMVVLSQVRVSAPMAARACAWRGSPGGEVDVAVLGGELDSADAVELAQCPGGAEVLVCEVGVVDVGCGEVADESAAELRCGTIANVLLVSALTITLT